MNADEIIKKLNLQKHPKEGGYFCETFRSTETVMDEQRGKRSICTAIYYLLTPDTFSEMHRLGVEEIFHFYLGDPVEMIHLFPDGSARRVVLGSDIANGMQPQVFVPKDIWQGSRLIPGGKFALMGTTVSPGFEYSDYEPGSRAELIRLYPAYKESILSLTPPRGDYGTAPHGEG